MATDSNTRRQLLAQPLLCLASLYPQSAGGKAAYNLLPVYITYFSRIFIHNFIKYQLFFDSLAIS